MTFSETLAKTQQEFPKLRVKRYRDNAFFFILMVLGWKMGATTIWNTIYMADDLIDTDRGVETLQHELVHVRDQHRWHVLFFLSYFLLPIGPSLKALWEWRAYKETLRVIWEDLKNEEPGHRVYLLGWYGEWVAKQFWSAGYVWMWPFPSMVRKWCAKEVSRLVGGPSRS